MNTPTKEAVEAAIAYVRRRRQPDEITMRQSVFVPVTPFEQWQYAARILAARVAELEAEAERLEARLAEEIMYSKEY